VCKRTLALRELWKWFASTPPSSSGGSATGASKALDRLLTRSLAVLASLPVTSTSTTLVR
jgi:hypothetical protein